MRRCLNKRAQSDIKSLATGPFYIFLYSWYLDCRFGEISNFLDRFFRPNSKILTQSIHLNKNMKKML